MLSMIKNTISKLKNNTKIFYLLTSITMTTFLFFGSVATEVMINPVSAPAGLPALPPDDVISFAGRGWGHGIGMCQYGSYGQAKQKRNYQQILSFYYKDSSIGNSTNPVVRVELLSGQGVAGITGTGNFVIKNNTTGAVIANGTSGQVWSVVPNGSGKVNVKNPQGKVIGTYSSHIRFEPSPATSSSLLKVTNNAKRYRGFIVIKLATVSSVRIVNNVVLEDYIKGIAEVPAGWPVEALKAQAVAARSYALAKMNAKASFDLYSDQRSQVYNGYEKEVSWMGSSWVSAATATSGKISTYGGKPITAYYFSTCGGSTENSENVWSSAVPYLKAQACDYCSSSPKYKWSVSFSAANLANKLNASAETKFSGKLAGLSIVSRKGPRRVGIVSILSTEGRRDVTGDALRRSLGLNSTWLDINDLKISSTSVSPNPLSPNGDGISDLATYNFTINRAATMSIKIYNYKGLAATVLRSASKAAGTHKQTWNGKNDIGNIVADGGYKYVVSGRTATGSSSAVSGLIKVKNAPTLSNVRASPNPFSPNGDAYREATYLKFALDNPARITAKLFNSSGAQEAVIAQNVNKSAGNRFIKWNGLNNYGKVVKDGTYKLKLAAVNPYGSSSTEISIRLNGTPRISVVSFLPNPFTPNGDQNNDSALLKFTTNCESTLKVIIKNQQGAIVKRLITSEVFPAGTHSRRWYGKDINGNLVAKGTYDFIIQATNQSGIRLHEGKIQVN